MTGSAVVTDSHVHLWSRERFHYEWLNGEHATLRRDFLPEDLETAHASVHDAHIAGSVFVQADCLPDESLAEASWVQASADAGAPIVAAVAAARLEGGALVAKELADLAALPLVAGVRRLLQDESSGFAVHDDFVTGVRLLASHDFTMDLCVREWQLPEVTQLASLCPEVTFVLDHLGKPTVSADAFPQWADNLARLADAPNVRCKLSGLASEAPPHMRHAEALMPWLRHALEVFGPERCMFGSDWPVVTSAMSYGAWLDAVLQAIEPLNAADQVCVLTGTARGTYDPLRRAPDAKEASRWR